MKPFRWGIFGTGSISAKFVAGLASASNAEATFVASRSLARAQEFAAGCGIRKAIVGYAEAAAQRGVDAIYIATPPSEHAAHASLCIEAGTPVLIEKPLAFTSVEAAQIVGLARARSVFVMEAMWTRFLPAAIAMRDLVVTRGIGEVKIVQANFGTSHNPDPISSLFSRPLGGGALAHLGPYPLSLAQWMFGSPVVVQAMGRIGSTGVDEDAAFQLQYPGGIIGSFFVSIRAWAPDDFHVLGTDGMASVRGSIVRPTGLITSLEKPRNAERVQYGLPARLRQNSIVHQIAQRVGRSTRGSRKRSNHFYTGNGYHYEADEVRACIEGGATESVNMPLADSLAVATTIDALRAQIVSSLA